MAKKRFISLLLAFTLLVSMLPVGQNAVQAIEEGDNKVTFVNLVNSVDILFEKISTRIPIERKIAVSILKNFVINDEGINNLGDLISGMTKDDPEALLGTDFTNSYLNAIEQNGITLTQAAQSVNLLKVLDSKDRVKLIESLDTDNPIDLLDKVKQQDFLSDFTTKYPNIETILSDTGIDIDEFSYLMYLARTSVGEPIFIDGYDTPFKLNSRLSDEDGLFTKMDNALLGLTISGITYTQGTTTSLYKSIEDEINNLILNSTDTVSTEQDIKGIFGDYDLYQSANPTIKLVPVYDIIAGDTEKALVNIVLRNFERIEDLSSLQIDVDYDVDPNSIPNLNESADVGSMEYNKVVEGYLANLIKDTDHLSRPLISVSKNDGMNKKLTYAITGDLSTAIGSKDDFVLATLEFNPSRQGNIALCVNDIILTNHDNVDLDTDKLNLATYPGLIQIGKTEEVINRDLLVQVNGQSIPNDNTISLGTNYATISGLVYPADSIVTINNHVLTTSEINNVNGRFKYTIENLLEGNNTIIVVAGEGTNKVQKTITVIVDSAKPSGQLKVIPKEGHSAERGYTNQTLIGLEISSANTDKVYVSNDENFAISEEFTPDSNGDVVADWTLVDGDGLKTVYVKFIRELDGVDPTIISKTIILDSVVPEITQIGTTAEGNLLPGDTVTFYAKFAENERISDGTLTVTKSNGNTETLNDIEIGYGEVSFNYTVPEDNNISNIKVNLTDRANNKAEASQDMTLPIVFMGSLKINFVDENNNPVYDLGFSLHNQITGESIFGVLFSDTNSYQFNRLPVGDNIYTLEWYPLYDTEKYIEGKINDISVTNGQINEINASVEKVPTGTLTLTVYEQDTENKLSGIDVYAYSKDETNYWDMRSTNSEGIVVFNNIPLNKINNTEIFYDIYAGTYANKSGSVTFNAGEASINQSISLPVSKKITGTVFGKDGTPLQNIEVWAFNSGSWSYAKTNLEGKYELIGLTSGTYTIGVSAFNSSDGNSYLYKEINNVNADDGILQNDIYLEAASRISGTVTMSDQASAKDIFVRAIPEDQTTYGWARTDQNGNYTMEGLKEGKYTVVVDWVEGYDYYSFSDLLVNNNGTTTNHDILLNKTASTDNSFTGVGNSIKVDREFVAPNGVVNYIVNFKNNNIGNIQNTEINIKLPEGFTPLALSDGLVKTADGVKLNVGGLNHDQSGTFSFAARAGNNMLSGQVYTATANAKWSPNGTDIISETFAVSTVETLTSTLNGPNKVNTSSIKLYGEASPDAEVLIFEEGKDHPLAIATATGRYWTAGITLDAVGVHNIYTRSRINGQQSEASDILTVEYEPNLLSLDKASVSAGWNGTVETNKKIGVVTLAVSQGQSMMVSATVPSNNGTSLNGNPVFIFGGKSYSSSKNGDVYSANNLLVDRSLSGTQKLIVQFTDNHGTSYDIPLANIIILIDPSGYVYDVVEGENTKLDDIIMTLEVKEDSNNDGTLDTWKLWNAPAYGQVNPQTSSELDGKHGKYGWDVPGGDGTNSPTIYYKVNALDPSGKYAPYNTGMEPSKWVDNGQGIGVLPARFDVHIGLVDQTNPIITSRLPLNGATNVGFKDDIKITFNKKMDETSINSSNILITEVESGNNVAGSVSYDEATRTATFDPNEDLRANTEYQVLVKGNVKSKHGLTATDEEYQTYLDLYNRTMGANVNWKFKTSDIVKSTEPTNGANNIDINKVITIEFNKGMNEASLENPTNVKLLNSNVEISTTLNYDANTKTLTITPTQSLEYSTNYTVEINNALDADSNNVKDILFGFTTEASTGGTGGFTGGTSGVIETNGENVTVGPEGGIAKFLDNQVIMDIEEGTFDSSTVINVGKKNEEDVTLPANTSTTKIKLASFIYEFYSGGKSFNQPIAVTLSYDKSQVQDPSKLGVYYYNEQTNEWQYIGGKINLENGTITVKLDHFSKYAVMSYEKSFNDIGNHWAKEDIELMAAKHVVTGKTDEEFKPNGEITRAEFATMLVRVLGIKIIENSSSFEDVSANAWYGPYVETAYKAGLVKGISETTFDPQANINREQMATMIMRAYDQLAGEDYASRNSTTQVRFMDESTISSWAHQAVIIANDLGIVTGMTKTTFVPKANATRAQAAVMIKRLLQAAGNL